MYHAQNKQEKRQARGKICKYLAMVLCVGILVSCPNSSLPLYTVDVTNNIVYAVGNVSDGSEPVVWETRDLLLDVYEPVDNPDPMKAALVLVHGGGFTEGSKEKEEIVEYATFFARRGFVCFAIDYRLRDDYPPAPNYWEAVPLSVAAHAAMVDVKAAIRFVRANAEDYGIDPDKIALLGESAGAIAGVAAAVSDPNAFETDGPEFPLPESNYPDVWPKVQAYIHLWGSADHVLLEVDADDPPTMIVHGTEDEQLLTLFSAAKRFHLVLEQADVPHEFYPADGFGHGAWEYKNNGKGLKLLILDFLNEHL